MQILFNGEHFKKLHFKNVHLADNCNTSLYPQSVLSAAPRSQT